MRDPEDDYGNEDANIVDEDRVLKIKTLLYNTYKQSNGLLKLQDFVEAMEDLSLKTQGERYLKNIF